MLWCIVAALSPGRGKKPLRVCDGGNTALHAHDGIARTGCITRLESACLLAQATFHRIPAETSLPYGILHECALSNAPFQSSN